MTRAQKTPAANETRQSDLLAERFTLVFGRRPSDADLVHFQRARVGLELRLPAQLRRVAATMVATL